MELQQRINAFAALGFFLGQFVSKNPSKAENIPHNDEFFEQMEAALISAERANTWFTKDNLQHACKSWADVLTQSNLSQWLSVYTISETKTTKSVAIVMAGNIPLVGFHDFMSVLLTGHNVIAKLSSNDTVLLPLLSKYLIAVAPDFKNRIKITKEKLPSFDAVIATGSNNTALYFEHYFGKYPNIIRKNRNSIAILTGEETPSQMEALADDIFRYFGLGCRNVSKIYVPKDYNWDVFFNAMFRWKDVINNHKYINNYDYNKAVYLMSSIKLLDNEFLLLKEDSGFSSPIAVVFYESYTNLSELEKKLAVEAENIQCIVSASNVPFGVAQKPSLLDYADGEDTIAFLTEL